MIEASVSRPETHRQIEGQLPESKIFHLLSSVGNGENKALELIVMRAGVIYSRAALYHEVMDHQEKNRMWKMNHSTPFSHCQWSLSPIGLVVKESLSPDDTAWGYEITQYGIRTGVPFAGDLLKWSHEHPQHSLYKMFGSTNSTIIKDEQTLEKKRAQETRYKIFWEIVTNPNNRIRLADVANAINENPIQVGVHLESLSKNGFISYEVSEPGQSYSYFRRKEIVPDKEPEQYDKNKKLSARICELLNREYLSVGAIADCLIQRCSEYENRKRKEFIGPISAVLTYFEKQGYMERRKFSFDFHSEVTISEEQRKVILSLVTVIGNFKTGDKETIEAGRKFAQRIQSDPKLFSELMLKAKEASPNANQTSAEDMHAYLISIIYAHPDSTVQHIQEVLKKDYDKIITRVGIRHSLFTLVREGKIELEKTKAGNIYRIGEDDKN